MRGLRSTNIKFFLLAVAFILVLGILYYSQYIVTNLQTIVHQLLRDEQKVANLYAKTIEHVANSETPTDFEFLFDKIISAIDFPLIETDASGNVIKSYRNVVLDSALSDSAQTFFLRQLVKKMDEQNPPIKIVYQETLVVSEIHYSESHTIISIRKMIVQLQQLPYVEISLGAMFVLLAYFGFSYLKRNEQSSIWVGMSKETAHQLGTPLSSMMGWLEIIKSQLQRDTDEREKALETISEMENDIQRLNKVAERFSKIGSKPNLKEENILEIIQTIVEYFQKRINTSTRFGAGKQVAFQLHHSGEALARVNRELLEWVFENLVKNAIDAIETKNGSITFSLEGNNKVLCIDVADTGKGIIAQHRKEVFRPGYSTKERGWGLGLTLSKRIIEMYHKGKLELVESKAGKGTTFRITLPK
ncbi:MAG: HAMP domain-containing histidine kinase [Ignavibacteria bacterium]|nr:HAMP domain-containing histidine kinase [Ignavibacteria bacterium]